MITSADRYSSGNVGGVDVVTGAPAGTIATYNTPATSANSGSVSVDINNVRSRYATDYGPIAAQYASETDLIIAARNWYGDGVNVTGSLPVQLANGGYGAPDTSGTNFSSGTIIKEVVSDRGIAVMYQTGTNQYGVADLKTLSGADRQAAINYAWQNNVDITMNQTLTASPANMFKVNSPVVVVPDLGGDTFQASRSYLSQFAPGTPIRFENSPTVYFAWYGGLMNQNARYLTGWGASVATSTPDGIVGTLTGEVRGPPDPYTGTKVTGPDFYATPQQATPITAVAASINIYNGTRSAPSAPVLWGPGGQLPTTPAIMASPASPRVLEAGLVPDLGPIGSQIGGAISGAVGRLWDMIPVNQGQQAAAAANAANAAQLAQWQNNPAQFQQWSGNWSKYGSPADPATQGYTPVEVDVKQWSEGNTAYRQFRTIYLDSTPDMTGHVLTTPNQDSQPLYMVGGYGTGGKPVALDPTLTGFYNYLGEAQVKASQTLGPAAIVPNIVMATGQSFVAVPLMFQAATQGAPVMQSLKMDVTYSNTMYGDANSIMQSGFGGIVNLGLMAYTPNLKPASAYTKTGTLDFEENAAALRTMPGQTTPKITFNEYSTIGQVKTVVENANEFSTIGQFRDISTAAAYMANNSATGTVQAFDTAKSVLNPFDNPGSQSRWNAAATQFRNSPDGWMEYNIISRTRDELAARQMYPDIDYWTSQVEQPGSAGFTMRSTYTPEYGNVRVKTIGELSYNVPTGPGSYEMMNYEIGSQLEQLFPHAGEFERVTPGQYIRNVYDKISDLPIGFGVRFEREAVVTMESRPSLFREVPTESERIPSYIGDYDYRATWDTPDLVEVENVMGRSVFEGQSLISRGILSGVDGAMSARNSAKNNDLTSMRFFDNSIVDTFTHEDHDYGLIDMTALSTGQLTGQTIGQTTLQKTIQVPATMSIFSQGYDYQPTTRYAPAPPLWFPSLDTSPGPLRTPDILSEFGQAYVNFDFTDDYGFEFGNPRRQPRRTTKKRRAHKR